MDKVNSRKAASVILLLVAFWMLAKPPVHAEKAATLTNLQYEQETFKAGRFTVTVVEDKRRKVVCYIAEDRASTVASNSCVKL